MDLDQKIDVLEQIYRIHAEALGQFGVACQKGCSVCCTTHLTLTTLEGMYLRTVLPDDDRHDLIAAACRRPRLIPQITTNQMASHCAAGMDLPEETYPATLTPCPLLRDQVCSVYEYRPLGCRAMVSRQRCDADGQAEMDPFALTLNHVIMQYVEHVDQPGRFGNICDMMQALGQDSLRQAYLQGRLDPATRLLANHPLTVLMAPPEHRKRLMPIMEKLNQIRIQRRCG